MKLRKQVVRLGLAQDLKKLGVKEDSIWYWIQNGEYADDWSEAFLESKEDMDNYNDEYYCSAFTVAELGEMLPFNYYSYKDEFDGWQCFLPIESSKNEIIGDTLWGPIARARQCRVSEEAKTEADARAKMLIFLINNGIVKGKDR